MPAASETRSEPPFFGRSAGTHRTKPTCQPSRRSDHPNRRVPTMRRGAHPSSADEGWAPRGHSPRYARLLAGVEHHRLDLGVLQDRVGAAGPPEATVLVAAERRPDDAGRAVLVDVDLAGLDALRELDRPLDVAGPDRGAEAVARPVGDVDRLVDVRELDTDRTGPKISSWATRMSGFTLLKRVGSTKKPLSNLAPASLLPPTTTSTPSCWATSM